MTGGLALRNSRPKNVLFVLAGVAFFFIIYLFTTTRSELKNVQSSWEKCTQQRDSLSAQLQVVYEHKNRLETTLQQEKKTKEDSRKKLSVLESQLSTEKDTFQKLQKELGQLRQDVALLKEEKQQLELEMTSQLQQVQQQKELESNKLHVQLQEVLKEKEGLKNQNLKQEWDIKQKSDELNFLQAQYKQLQSQLHQSIASSIKGRNNQSNTNFNQIPNSFTAQKINQYLVKPGETDFHGSVLHQPAVREENIRKQFGNVPQFYSPKMLQKPKVDLANSEGMYFNHRKMANNFVSRSGIIETKKNVNHLGLPKFPVGEPMKKLNNDLKPVNVHRKALPGENAKLVNNQRQWDSEHGDYVLANRIAASRRRLHTGSHVKEKRKVKKQYIDYDFKDPEDDSVGLDVDGDMLLAGDQNEELNYQNEKNKGLNNKNLLTQNQRVVKTERRS
ncbi:Golgi integral membrane protein 4-like [Limulus polyphemus]|uniref:Golgi integral membrane protein 4-like n=1 Tax=Limulus polyphemus TaxID=6850 RepID=A0ABM1BXH9_LIMPO|nr:Golgi integral membrane protein 4-like [Limulus polyphemus]